MLKWNKKNTFTGNHEFNIKETSINTKIRNIVMNVIRILLALFAVKINGEK